MSWELLGDAWVVLVALMSLAVGYGSLTQRVASLERHARDSKRADEKQGTHREIIAVQVAQSLERLENMAARMENVEKMMRENLHDRRAL